MPRPALSTLVPYTLGVLIAGFLPTPLFWLWLIALICLGGGVGLSHLWKGDVRTPRIQRLLLLGAICACGMFRLKVVLTSPIPPDFYDQQVHFSGEMAYQPERGEQWEAGYASGTIQPVGNPDLMVKTKLLIRFREPIPLRYGDRIEVEGVLRRPNEQRNPGGFDYRSYLARRGVFGILYPHRGQEIVPTDRSGFPLLHWTEKLRRRVEAVIDAAYRENRIHSQVLKGMLLGQQSGLSPDILDAFRNSGSIHILAVSGLHVGLIATVCFFGFSLLRLPQKATDLLTIAAVILYACLVGFRPSVFRASLMAVIFLISRIIERDRDLFNLLAFAALVLLLMNPAQLWDIGFQLSFVAVASIVYLAPKWERFIARIARLNRTDPMADPDSRMVPRSVWGRAAWWLAMAFGVTLSAQVGTTLIIAWHFHRLYPIGLISGLFTVGLAAFLVNITLVSVLLGLIWLPLATPFVYANHFVLWIFLRLIEFFGQSWTTIKTPVPSFGFIAIYIAGCFAVIHWVWVWMHRKQAMVIGLMVLSVWIWDTAWRERGKLLEVTFLDVGQGDAAFVRFPDGKAMLIDGGLNSSRIEVTETGNARRVGYDNGERTLDPFLCQEGIFRLDLLLLSHPDNDHGGGFAHILREFGVKHVLGVPHQDLHQSTHRILHEIVDAKDIPHELGYAGTVDLTSTARLELLHPFDAASTNLQDKDVNNDSLVLRLTYGDVRILFTGDIGRKVELRLVESGKDLGAEIIKVPHHGSKTSSSAEFLDAVHPQYAIFSLGQRNRYRFPSEMVLERYRERGCRILRTDRLGAIRLLTDGRRCWVTHHVEER